jgi:alpha-beta hydrolase superfamily lysophospholipase
MSDYRGHPVRWDVGTGVAGFHWATSNPRAAVLLQHGLSEYSERYVDYYHALVPTLVRQGFSVYAIDFEGHGRSPGTRVDTDVPTCVRHHRAAREVLRHQPLPIFLFGHSLGGLVTATSVLDDPRQVAGVILSSAALYVEASGLRIAAARLLARIWPSCPVGRLDPSGLSRVESIVQASLQDPLKYHGVLKARMAASIVEVSQANWSRYPEWQAPVLALHGTADRYTAVQGSERFIATVGAADKTLFLQPGGYHELLNDLGADEVLDCLLGWLDRHCPAAR